jgi:hypothetical protein
VPIDNGRQENLPPVVCSLMITSGAAKSKPWSVPFMVTSTNRLVATRIPGGVSFNVFAFLTGDDDSLTY